MPSAQTSDPLQTHGLLLFRGTAIAVASSSMLSAGLLTSAHWPIFSHANFASTDGSGGRAAREALRACKHILGVRCFAVHRDNDQAPFNYNSPPRFVADVSHVQCAVKIYFANGTTAHT